jgi:hypothetical protein
VRAVLAELEAAGYLRKPHTSAGRVPTEEGLRLFAEAMVHLSDRTTARDEELARRLSEVALGLDVVLRNASKVLAEMTGSAALLRPPRADAWVLRDLRFLLLRPRELLAVIVSSTGGVEHRVLRVEHTPSPAELDRVNNLLRARIEGPHAQRGARPPSRKTSPPSGPAPPWPRARPASRCAPWRLAKPPCRPCRRVPTTCSWRAPPSSSSGPSLPASTAPAPSCAPSTTARCSCPCSTARRRARGCAWSSAGDGTGAGFSAELSLVMARFDQGVVGVLGSSRMDYSQVVPLVRQTAARLSELLREG